MNRFLIFTLFIVSFISACATTGSSRQPQIPSVQGAALTTVSNDARLTDEAVKVSETYLNAQKNADRELFRSVTPHESMNIIFDWSYINKSKVTIESAALLGIKDHVLKFNEHQNNYHSMPKYSRASIGELEAAASYADSIEKGGYPMLGNLMKKGYWEAVIPTTLAGLSNYKLMNMEYIADIKAQSRGGLSLQKRVTLVLYRMQADSYDSGWKVLFVLGL
ncbi:hypothetical protein ER57_07020 [Smithella sp. SCADC]|jgi:hypothetical protein|nr:hypothetical protein ER57_07020 [Smithella sp. SCADC]